MEQLQISVLGVLEVVDGGRTFTPGAARLRQTLAMLAVSPGRLVPTETIARELWPSARPRNPVTTIQTYVYELRKALNGRPCVRRAEVLRTEESGYRLRIAGHQVDAVRFIDLVSRGEALLDHDRRRRQRGEPDGAPTGPAAAAEVLREALRMWRGGPFVGTPTGPRLSQYAQLLEKAWIRAIERRTRADLLLGRHRELVSELQALTVDHPSNETFHAQLMVALYRGGRRGDALQVYGRIRQALADEGLEPSQRLSWLRYRILGAHGQDSTLDRLGI